MKLRGVLLGCGQVSRHHLRAWRMIDEVEIVALYNRTISKAQERAKEFGIPSNHVYGDYHELLEKEEFDFVDIATAPQVHREQVEAASAYGRPILCQKPLAPSLEDARAMVATCEAAGVMLSVNENWRWRSWYRALKRILETEVIGRVRYVSIVKHRSIALPGFGMTPPPISAEPDAMRQDRLIVYGWGVHLFDLLRFLLGDVDSLYARMANVSPCVKGEDRALIVVNIGQIIGIIDISWASVLARPDSVNVDTRPENIVIEGERGTIELPENGNVIRIITGDAISEEPASEETPLEAYQSSYTAAQRHFIHCTLSGQLPETTARDNLRTLAAAFAAYESASNNRVVRLQYIE